MTLGKYLKEYRKRMQLSQRALAVRCNVSHAYIGFLEKGVNPATGEPLKPSLANLHKIANGMGVRLDELLSAVDDMIITLDSGESVPGEQVEKALETEADTLENFLLMVYRDMNPDGQQRLNEQAAMLYEKYRKEEQS
jgi:transcriptional regulator with XRE-family HTH domain